MTEAPEDPALHAVIETLLLERGPLTVAELAAVLEESGFGLGRDPEAAVLDAMYASFCAPFVHLDERWAHLPALLRDRVFTHRLTAPEIDHDLLTISPDLAAIVGLEDADLLRLADGAEVTVTYGLAPDDLPELDAARTEAIAEHGSIVLPTSTLTDLEARPGDLISITVTDRAIELARVDDEAKAFPETVRSHLIEIASGGTPVELETAALTLCADLDDAFRSPHPPFGDLLADAGLARNGDWVASAGFDFAAYWTDVRARSLADRHGLSHDQALAVAALVTLHRGVLDVFKAAHRTQTPDGQLDRDEFGTALASINPTTTPGPGRSVGSLLHHIAAPEVAEAFLAEKEDWDHPLGDEALAMMVELMEDQVGRAARPALRWLRAMAYERLGRVSEAEQTLLAAERLDPTWPLTLLDLARYASDRGDSSRGLALLARADPYEDPDLVKLLQAFRPEPGPTVGRNDPCWCGSGRKFKQCHLHRPSVPPLEERAAWLYQKAGTYLSGGAWYPLISLVAAERAAYAEGEAAVEAAVRDPVVADVVLFEGGAFAEFVQQRGFLLPDDERLLADQWLLVERSVFEITAVRRGAGFTVRDLRTGEVHDVRERTASRQLKPGQLICARVVPAGETWQIFGGIEPVALHHRDKLLSLLDTDPEPDELMAFLARRYAPPTIVTTEGDPLVIADVVLEVGDPAAVTAALDRAYARDEDSDPPEWRDTQRIEGADRIRATLRLTGSEVRINATSDRRMDDVLATIRQADPAATVRSDEREPITDARVARRLAEQRRPSGSALIAPDTAPPEVQQALAAYMQTYEKEWLDLPVPALSGLTPRQAADDPTRRDDLVRLLASFGDADGPTEMSARRLRSALGLADA